MSALITMYTIFIEIENDKNVMLMHACMLLLALGVIVALPYSRCLVASQSISALTPPGRSCRMHARC